MCQKPRSMSGIQDQVPRCSQSAGSSQALTRQVWGREREGLSPEEGVAEFL